MPGGQAASANVGERTRMINRMKAALIRLGVRGFQPELLKAPQRLEAPRSARREWERSPAWLRQGPF